MGGGNADCTFIVIKQDLPLRFAVISDWGPILEKPYKPLNDTLDYILDKRVK